MRVLLVLSLVAASVAAPIALADGEPAVVDLAVIVNPQNRTLRLDGSELTEIFTASRRTWPDGQAITAFNLPANDPLRVAFDRAVVGMGPDEVGRFWVDQRIRGGAKPPRQIDDPKLMLRIVAHMPGAIGYVPSDLVDGSVRVVARVVRGQIVTP